MPELPEVETIARTLAPQILGRSIREVKLLCAKTLQGPHALELIRGRTVESVGRRGKLLLLRFAPDGGEIQGLAFHLKMTGRVFVYPHGTKPGPHTRAVLELDQDQLFFDDSRKFGLIRLISEQSLQSWDFWQKLGPEPFDITPEAFAARFSGRNAPIKTLLLNQTLVAGCGNIYADESLFRAGILPTARNVSPGRLMKLHQALCEVLQESIAACGSSIRDYRDARGDAGAFQNQFQVYGRAGEACKGCGKKLAGIRLGGRATVYCKHCQS